MAELVCNFNYNEPIMKYFTGFERADEVDMKEIYDQIENVKFINVNGLYWTYLRDSYHIID